MNALVALGAIVVLVAIAWLGAALDVTRPVFALLIPALGFVVCLGGLAVRVWRFAATPVPFRIPTTCGQQQSLGWIKASRIENPSSTAGVVARMALELLAFRSLFRNSRAATWIELSDPIGSRGAIDTAPLARRLIEGEQKWLWLAALGFHYSLLVIAIRHLRLVMEPVPGLVAAVAAADGFFQIGSPVLYASDVILMAALAYLTLRRLLDAKVRFISLPQDYFVLFLLAAVVASGVLMRHVVRQDVVAAKELAMGLVTLAPGVPSALGVFVVVHVSLAAALLACLPFSKLVHAAGAVLSPTRNLANTSRMTRHVNPWDAPVAVHSYDEWEDEFRDKMKTAGLPVERA